MDHPTSYNQVSHASVAVAKPCKVDGPHLLGLDPGLPGVSGAVLQCRKYNGQEVDGDEACEYRNRLVAFQVIHMFNMCIMKAKLSICRVHFPLTANRAQISETGGKARVPKWTSLNSFNLLWLLWAICGGFFITNFLLSNWLTMLVMPVFDKPVDIAQVIREPFIKNGIFHTFFPLRQKVWKIFEIFFSRRVPPQKTWSKMASNAF